MPQTWILTGSPENHAVTRELGYTLIGFKERRRGPPRRKRSASR